MKCRIYKLINDENNEIYIGSTTQSLNDRFWSMTKTHSKETAANEYRRKYSSCQIVQIGEIEIPYKYAPERFALEQHFIDTYPGIKVNKIPAYNPNAKKDALRRYREKNREKMNEKDRERAVCPECGQEKMKRYIKYHLQRGCENGRRSKIN